MSGSGSDSDEEEAGGGGGGGGGGDAAAYEGPDALATVTVEPLSLSRSPTPDPDGTFPTSLDSSRSTTGQQQQQGSVHKKRVKNAPQARPKLSRQEKKERATGAKKVKKRLANKMKGTRGRANK